jgi:hypothetical protein
MNTSYLKQPAPIKITVEGGLTENHSIQLTIPSCSTIEEWIETFRTILVHQGFQFDTITQLFDEPDCCGDCCSESSEDSDAPQFLQESKF